MVTIYYSENCDRFATKNCDKNCNKYENCDRFVTKNCDNNCDKYESYDKDMQQELQPELRQTLGWGGEPILYRDIWSRGSVE